MATGSISAWARMDDEGDGKERAAGPGLCCGSTTLSALWATVAFNTVFTLAQCFGAVLANSVALLSDTGTMFVDSLTYACNIGAEYLKVRVRDQGQGPSDRAHSDRARPQIGATSGVTRCGCLSCVRCVGRASARRRQSTCLRQGFQPWRSLPSPPSPSTRRCSDCSPLEREIRVVRWRR